MKNYYNYINKSNIFKGVKEMKKNLSIIILATLTLALVACGATSSESSDSVESEVEADTESVADDSIENQDALQEAFKDAIGGSGLTFYSTVPNDATGKWRCAVIYTGEDMVEHALDYYKAYFTSDDEIHFICNLGLKTTTSIKVIFDSLQVDVHEYVDKEEHDANLLNSGSLLKSYMINIESGEVEEL